MNRWIASGLLLLALVPGDLALVQAALRHDRATALTQHGLAALRAQTGRVVETGETLLGRSVHVMGTAMFDAACWVADQAADRLPGRVWIRQADPARVARLETHRSEDRVVCVELEHCIAARAAAEQARDSRVVARIARLTAREHALVALRRIELATLPPAPAEAPPTPVKTGS